MESAETQAVNEAERRRTSQLLLSKHPCLQKRREERCNRAQTYTLVATTAARVIRVSSIKVHFRFPPTAGTSSASQTRRPLRLTPDIDPRRRLAHTRPIQRSRAPQHPSTKARAHPSTTPPGCQHAHCNAPRPQCLPRCNNTTALAHAVLAALHPRHFHAPLDCTLSDLAGSTWQRVRQENQTQKKSVLTGQRCTREEQRSNSKRTVTCSQSPPGAGAPGARKPPHPTLQSTPAPQHDPSRRAAAQRAQRRTQQARPLSTPAQQTRRASSRPRRPPQAVAEQPREPSSQHTSAQRGPEARDRQIAREPALPSPDPRPKPIPTAGARRARPSRAPRTPRAGRTERGPRRAGPRAAAGSCPKAAARLPPPPPPQNQG